MRVNYAILRHEGIAAPHFDLLFETRPRSELAAWRSAQWPIEAAVTLVRLKDHRRVYLEYEGELSERRGFVRRVAHGTCELEIGENAVWTIRLLTGSTPQKLVIRQIKDEQWEVFSQ